MPTPSNTRITTQCKGWDHTGLAAAWHSVTAGTHLITLLLLLLA